MATTPISLALLVLVIGLPHSAAAQQAVSDSARLQGTWTMRSGSAGGQALPPDYVAGMKRVNLGNEVTVTLRGQVFFQATIRLDPAQTPHTIDYHMTAGPSAGAVQLGIYAISGDTVRFCFGSPNAPRPADFTSVAGDGRTLSTWVRARP